MGRPIAAGTSLFDAMMVNEAVVRDETINGVVYATRYKPIAMANGTVIGGACLWQWTGPLSKRLLARA